MLSMLDKSILLSIKDVNIFKNKILNNDSFVSKKRIVCVDFGTKKLGVAVSDVDKTVAFPKDVIFGKFYDINTLILEIKYQINKYDAIGVIIGWPIGLNGEFNDNCYKISKVAIELNKNIPVLLFDERYTTKFAQRKIEERNNFKKNKKIKNNGLDDAMSAMIILNDFLSILNNTSI